MSDLLPKAIAFDLDGTLIDSLPGIQFSIDSAMARCGVRQRNIDLRSIIGPPIRVILSLLADGTEASLDDLETAFRRSYDSDGWTRTKLFPGTAAVLATLQAEGIRLFVVTNKPRHISMKILEQAQIDRVFEGIITRDSRQPPYSNKREMLDHLRNCYGLYGPDCLFVGDTEEDGVAAAESGLKFALVTYGYGTISETHSFAICFQTSDLSRLSELLQVEFAHD